MAVNFLNSINLRGNQLQNASLHPNGTEPQGPTLGQIFYDTSALKVKIWNGTQWDVVGNTYTAGNGLTLSNLQFSAVAYDGITVDANGISVNSTVVRTSGDQTIAGDKTFSNNVIVSGDLTVSGTTTTVNTETILLADNIITLNSNFGVGSGAASEDSGIEVSRGDEPTVGIIFDEAKDRWTFTNDGVGYSDIPVPQDYAYSITTVAGSNSTSEKIRLVTPGGNDDIVIAVAGTALSIAQSTDTITITGNTLTAEQVYDYVADVMVGNATHTGISASDVDGSNAVNLVNAHNVVQIELTVASPGVQSIGMTSNGIDPNQACVIQVYEMDGDVKTLAMTDTVIKPSLDTCEIYLPVGIYKIHIAGYRA